MTFQIEVKSILIDAVYPVRQAVLRKGKPFESCKFDNDLDDTTTHYGVFQDNKLAGVATILKNDYQQIHATSQYQLRGMAILDAFQGKGLGSYLVKHIIKIYNPSTIWCNAREKAVPFYNKNQFSVIGSAFHIPKIGLHYVMHTLNQNSKS